MADEGDHHKLCLRLPRVGLRVRILLKMGLVGGIVSAARERQG